MRVCFLILGAVFISLEGHGQSYGDYAVKVDVVGNGFAHSSIVYFDDESWDPLLAPTYGWDPCCDALLVMGNANQPHIFTEVVAPPASPNNHRLTINGLPHLFEPTDVPLGFLPGTLAQYTFTFKELYTLPVGVTVELEDLAQNVTQDLILDSTYVTWGATSDNEARFILHFYPENVTGANGPNDPFSNIRIENYPGQTSILGLQSIPNPQIRLVDMLGTVVWSQRTVTDDVVWLDNSSLANGLYILEFISDQNTRKIFKINLY